MSSSSSLPPGPSTLAEMLDIVPMYVDLTLKQWGSSVLLKNWKKLLLTTRYSGLGTVEWVADQIAAARQERLRSRHDCSMTALVLVNLCIGM